MSTTGLRFSFKKKKTGWDTEVRNGHFSLGMELCYSVRSLHWAPQLIVPLAAKVSSTGFGKPHFTTRFISCKGKPPTNWLHHILTMTFLLQSYNPHSHGRCSYPRAILFIWWRSSSLAEWASASSILAWASFCLRHSFSSMSWKDSWKTRDLNHFLKM